LKSWKSTKKTNKRKGPLQRNLTSPFPETCINFRVQPNVIDSRSKRKIHARISVEWWQKGCRSWSNSLWLRYWIKECSYCSNWNCKRMSVPFRRGRSVKMLKSVVEDFCFEKMYRWSRNREPWSCRVLGALWLLPSRIIRRAGETYSTGKPWEAKLVTPPRRLSDKYCLQNSQCPPLFSLIIIWHLIVSVLRAHLPLIPCTQILNSMAAKIAQGIQTSMIRLAVTPNPKPTVEAAAIANTKIGVWYRSLSWRLYANEEIEQPNMIQDKSIRPGEGSKIKLK